MFQCVHVACGWSAGIPHTQILYPAQRNSCLCLAQIADVQLQLRVGAHCGTVVMGVIGQTKTCFDLWGDTVNVASRMESTGVAGRIQVSTSLRGKLPPVYCWEPRIVAVKGKGDLMAHLLQLPDSPRHDNGVRGVRRASEIRSVMTIVETECESTIAKGSISEFSNTSTAWSEATSGKNSV